MPIGAKPCAMLIFIASSKDNTNFGSTYLLSGGYRRNCRFRRLYTAEELETFYLHLLDHTRNGR